VLAVPIAADAATVWNGPRITFVRLNGAESSLPQNQDRITPNVWLARGDTMGLYNARRELNYGFGSPSDTEWAYGTTADYASLTYRSWLDWAESGPPGTVGRNAVLHLKTDDIYIDIKFRSWTQSSGGGFSYQRSTPSGGGPTTASAIEYYHQAFDHYFVTRNADEITKLDNGTFVGWMRTTLSFNVYPSATAGAASVCRFFSTAFDPRSSHFYTPFPAECTMVKGNPSWQFEGEGTDVFFIPLAAANGTCGAGTLAVYRLYNNGQGGAPNHRYTTSSSVRDQMIAAGWTLEGNGPGFAFMCSPN
jgi:hypothetical protein